MRQNEVVEYNGLNYLVEFSYNGNNGLPYICISRLGEMLWDINPHHVKVVFNSSDIRKLLEEEGYLECMS